MEADSCALFGTFKMSQAGGAGKKRLILKLIFNTSRIVSESH